MNRQSEKNVNDVWEVGGAYESFIGRWSRPVAAEFLGWLAIPAGRTWLDVGCGTGVLTQSILNLASPANVRGIDQAPGFISFAKNQVRDPRAVFAVGSADALSVTSDTYDVVVSGLLLNFLPDSDLAISELKRVTKPGGVVAAYVWDYADKMEVLRNFWDAAAMFDSRAARLDEGTRFPICHPEKLRNLFIDQGLSGVEVRPIDAPAHFPDFQDYWSPFLLGQGPGPSYVASLDEDQRSDLRERVRARLPISAEGTIDLIARAWAVRGKKGR